MWRKSLKEAVKMLKADMKNSRYALFIVAVYLLLKKFFLLSACPFVTLTGLPCPMCGMTRAGIALLQGDFKLAWKLHPFIIVIALWAVFFIVWRYFLKKEIKELKKYALATLVLLVIYYIYRMVIYFPQDPPMSYQYDNLLKGLSFILREI